MVMMMMGFLCGAAGSLIASKCGNDADFFDGILVAISIYITVVLILIFLGIDIGELP